MTCPGPDPAQGSAGARDTVLEVSFPICTCLHRYVHVHCRHLTHSSARSRQTAHSSTGEPQRGDTCSSKGHTRIYTHWTRQIRWMHDIESVAVGAQQVTSSHPPIACQDIASHLPLPCRRPCCPFACACVIESTPGHTTLTSCIKTTHRPRRPFTVLGVVLLFPHTSLDLIPSHLRQATVFSDLTAFHTLVVVIHLIP